MEVTQAVVTGFLLFLSCCVLAVTVHTVWLIRAIRVAVDRFEPKAAPSAARDA